MPHDYTFVARVTHTEEHGVIQLRITRDQAGFHIEWRGNMQWSDRPKRYVFTFYSEKTALNAFFMLQRNAIYSLPHVINKDISYDPYIMLMLNKVESMSVAEKKQVTDEVLAWFLERDLERRKNDP